MATVELRLEVLIQKQYVHVNDHHVERWVAQCLQHDVCAQAKTLPDVFYELERLLVGEIVVAQENGMKPFEGVPAAAQECWDAWERAVDVTEPPSPRFSVPPSTPTPRFYARVA